MLATCCQKVGKKTDLAKSILNSLIEEDKMNYRAFCILGLISY